ncbi:MAG: hypothetical protein QNJ63_21125 [Calothrix sp. MO_192.B10]|nr:hypothetical protein [Calothrix sp. MO_192.B10]
MPQLQRDCCRVLSDYQMSGSQQTNRQPFLFKVLKKKFEELVIALQVHHWNRNPSDNRRENVVDREHRLNIQAAGASTAELGDVRQSQTAIAV